MKVLATQLCRTLCDPTDCSPPGSSVHRILQARILEWAAIPFSRIFPNLGLKPGLLIAGRFFSVSSHQRSPPWESTNSLILIVKGIRLEALGHQG